MRTLGPGDAAVAHHFNRFSRLRGQLLKYPIARLASYLRSLAPIELTARPKELESGRTLSIAEGDLPRFSTAGGHVD